MEPFQPWEEPLPLIESKDGQLVVNSETAAFLQKIMQPVVVVAIAGTYRQGKSYLMNRLAKKQHGFELGSALVSKTKGIWVWCRKHPLHSDQVLVLMDTEGLGDPNKLDSEHHDMMILSLALLLSSTFIYNTFGKIDQDMIQKLHFVTQITENIKVKSKNDVEDDYSEYVKYFPAFVLAVRDFTLELIIEDENTKEKKAVTPNEYFNFVLKLKKGNTRPVMTHNLPREAIRNAFRSHDCFVFTRPVQEETLFPHLEKLREDELSSQFVEHSRQFCEHIFKNSDVKKLQRGQDANGRLLLALAKQYVEAINSGAVPCIESTLDYVTRTENERVVDEALQKYKEAMGNLPYPVPEEIFIDAHTEANNFAMEHFRRFSIFDAEDQFFEVLRAFLLKEHGDWFTHNEAKSRDFCNEYFQNAFAKSMKSSMENGTFAVAGGYKLYELSMKTLIDEYQKDTEGQIKAEEVKQEFLKMCENHRTLIIATDNSMTELEKQRENDRKKLEAAQLETRLQEEENRLERERLLQLQEEHKLEMKKMQDELNQSEEKHNQKTQELIDCRLEEQAQLLKEGFDKQAAELQEEIKKLEAEKSKNSVWATLLEKADQIANIISQAVTVRYLWKTAGNLASSAGKALPKGSRPRMPRKR